MKKWECLYCGSTCDECDNNCTHCGAPQLRSKRPEPETKPAEPIYYRDNTWKPAEPVEGWKWSGHYPYWYVITSTTTTNQPGTLSSGTTVYTSNNMNLSWSAAT